MYRLVFLHVQCVEKHPSHITTYPNQWNEMKWKQKCIVCQSTRAMMWFVNQNVKVKLAENRFSVITFSNHENPIHLILWKFSHVFLHTLTRNEEYMRQSYDMSYYRSWICMSWWGGRDESYPNNWFHSIWCAFFLSKISLWRGIDGWFSNESSSSPFRLNIALNWRNLI